MGENTEVYGSCSTTFQNEFYVFGGYREEYQIRYMFQQVVRLDLMVHLEPG